MVLAELRDTSPVTVKVDRRALRQGMTVILRGTKVAESLYLGPGLSLLLSEAAWRAASATRAGQEKQDQELLLLAHKLSADFRSLGTLSIKLTDEPHDLRIGVFEHLASGMKFHLIPGGEVLLGISPEQEILLSREFGAKTQQKIDVAERRKKGAKPLRVRPFLIAATEVSIAHWKSLGGESATKSRSGEEPIVGVSLEKAEAWLAGCPGGLRLPFQSEWEYACRGGKDTVWDSTDRFLPDNVWGAHNTKEPRSVKLHFKRHNSFGLCDMLGNASEWSRPEPGSAEALKLVASLHGGSFDSTLFFAAQRSPRVRGDAEAHAGLRPIRGLDIMRINKDLWTGDAR
jgi:formylglycine-generating enzyme required for sulfatase activity